MITSINPVALVTGASRGIGRGIAFELAALGYSLVINYTRQADAAQRTAVECLELAKTRGHAIRAAPFQADVSRSEDRSRLVEFARTTFGRLDLLVNNAGVAPETRADILEASEESFDRLISINVKGPYFLTQQVARWMIEQARARQAEEGPAGAATPGGKQTPQPPYRPRIVTISSISAYTASVNRGDYCVAKAALSMLTPLFATRLAEYGIQVFEIRPGIIKTDMTGPVTEKYDQLIHDGLTPIRRWGLPEDVGKAVAAIAQGLLPFSTGEVLNVDGGFHIRRL
jgi:NAD(P)-dependent dehydrogenase (short-subunit alcohol dehydrogenase family)